MDNIKNNNNLYITFFICGEYICRKDCEVCKQLGID
jgi:surface polysaccharide O-acyltransferase-like enzyme